MSIYKSILTVFILLLKVTIYSQATVSISGTIGLSSFPAGYVPKNFIIRCTDLTTGEARSQELIENSYKFEDLPAGHDYKIMLFRMPEDDYLNGVSTLDLVLISRHILGIAKFTNKYYNIAADVNDDRRVTVADMVELKKLILGITLNLPISWRVFTEEAFSQFPTYLGNNEKDYTFTGVNSDIDFAHFILVKMGDINGSAQ